MNTNTDTPNAQAENSLINFNDFEHGIHVRCVVRDDEPWFVAKDVCQVLEIVNHKDALSSLHEDERAKVGIPDLSSSSRKTVTVNAVNESGLYALIFKSRKPAAQAFRKWVTSEVLPEIRRRGRYDPVAVAQQLPPLARRALLQHRVGELEAELVRVRKQADLAMVLPGQYTVWQWLLLQGEDCDNNKGQIGGLSAKCQRVCQERGIETGLVKEIEHCGQRVRLSRTAHTYPEDILTEVCGASAA